MKVLDKYIVTTFAKVFLGTLLVFSLGVVALDFFSRLGHFGNAQRVADTFAEDYGKFELVAKFYLAYLPYVLKEVLPFVTVAAGLFTLTTMLKGNEVFPVIAAGVSARRIFRPIFLCSLVIVGGHLAFQEYVIPSLNREHIALKRFFAGDRKTEVDDVTHLRDGKGTVTRVGAYSFADQSLTDVVVQRPWTDAGFERWVAPRLEPAGERWRAPQGVVVHSAEIPVTTRSIPAGAVIDIGVAPADVEALASKQGAAEVSFSQLQRLIRKFPDRRHLRVAFHKQIVRPILSFVLLLVGIPMLFGLGRSSFLGAGVAFGLSATYYFMDIFFTSLGDRGDLPPVVAAWFPVALFFSLGVARLATVRS